MAVLQKLRHRSRSEVKSPSFNAFNKTDLKQLYRDLLKHKEAMPDIIRDIKAAAVFTFNVHHTSCQDLNGEVCNFFFFKKAPLLVGK